MHLAVRPVHPPWIRGCARSSQPPSLRAGVCGTSAPMRASVIVNHDPEQVERPEYTPPRCAPSTTSSTGPTSAASTTAKPAAATASTDSPPNVAMTNDAAVPVRLRLGPPSDPADRAGQANRARAVALKRTITPQIACAATRICSDPLPCYSRLINSRPCQLLVRRRARAAPRLLSRLTEDTGHAYRLFATSRHGVRSSYGGC